MSKVIPFQPTTTPANIIPLGNMALPTQAQATLTYCRDFITANGFSPSLREIGAAVCLSPSNVKRYLEMLMLKGYLTYTPKQPRSIRLCTPASDYEAVLWVALADLVKASRDLHSTDTARRLKAHKALDRAARLLELRSDYGPAA